MAVAGGRSSYRCSRTIRTADDPNTYILYSMKDKLSRCATHSTCDALVVGVLSLILLCHEAHPLFFGRGMLSYSFPCNGCGSLRGVRGCVGGGAAACGSSLDRSAYLTGLLLPGEREFVEPMAARPDPRHVGRAHQASNPFLANTPWNEGAVLAVAREYALAMLERHAPWAAWLVDETSFPKQGRHSAAPDDSTPGPGCCLDPLRPPVNFMTQ